MKNKLLFVCSTITVLLGSPLLRAQSQQVTVNAVVAEVLNLTVDATTVSFNFVATDYDANTGQASKANVQATTFRVSSNRDWSLSARANDPFFSFTANGTATNPQKPVSTLSIRTGTNAYTPFSGVTELTVASGNRGGYNQPGNSIPVDYQMTSALDSDPPGSYRATLTYTLVAR